MQRSGGLYLHEIRLSSLASLLQTLTRIATTLLIYYMILNVISSLGLGGKDYSDVAFSHCLLPFRRRDIASADSLPGSV
jgi:hypothetical protein